MDTKAQRHEGIPTTAHSKRQREQPQRKAAFDQSSAPGKDTGHDEDGGEDADALAQTPNPAGPGLGQALHPPGQKEL